MSLSSEVIRLPTSGVTVWHWGKPLWYFQPQCHWVCPNARGLPPNIPNMIMSLPDDISTSGVVLLEHFLFDWKCPEIAIWGCNFPPPTSGEKAPHKIGGSPAFGGDLPSLSTIGQWRSCSWTANSLSLKRLHYHWRRGYCWINGWKPGFLQCTSCVFTSFGWLIHYGHFLESII